MNNFPLFTVEKDVDGRELGLRNSDVLTRVHIAHCRRGAGSFKTH